MKKTILLLVSNLVFMTMFSQQVISNGEDTGLGWWQSGSTAVENVDWHPKGGNPSAKSFAIWISTNSDQWSGGGLSGLNINVSDYNTISLLVYKNVTGTVRLELQDGTSNYFVTANYTTAGVWQKLDFPIPSQMGNITTLLIAPFIDYDLSTIVGEQSRCFWDEVIAFNTYSISTSSNDNLLGSVSGSGNYDQSSNVSLSATANSSYRFVNWTENGAIVSTVNPYTFTASANRTIIANFDNATIVMTQNTNASTFASCSNCDITVSNNAVLNIDENKTLRNITINPNAKVTLNSGQNLTLNTFNIISNSDGNGTFVDYGGTLNAVTSNVQQYLTSGRNWYLSSPVTDATSAVFSASSTYPLFLYDEAHGSTVPWVQITNATTSLIPMQGFVANLASTNAVTFSGSLNSGNKSITVYRTAGQTREGFNLVGNPYPSYLDWEASSKTNLFTTMWYRTKSSNAYVFDTYNATGSIGTNNNGNGAMTKYIPPMQAFWVRVTEGQTQGILSLDNTMRSHSATSNMLKSRAINTVNQPLLRMQVSNGTNSDEAILYSNPNASNEFDNYDSPKISNAKNDIPEIYTLAGLEKVVINGLKSISPNQEFALGFTSETSNNFFIRAIEISNFDTGTHIILKDELMNTEQDLTEGIAYNFSSNAVKTASRFTVIFKTNSVTTAVSNTFDNSNFIFIFKNANNQITINIPTEVVGKANVSVYNTVGQKLENELLTSTVNVLSNSYTSGVYLVSVFTNGKTINRKMVIN